MTEEQIAYMVSQFNAWTVPAGFAPYAGVGYVPPIYGNRSALPKGAHILNAGQVDAMVRNMIDGLPPDV